MTNKQERSATGCCAKCFDYDNDGGRFCVTSSCPCHTLPQESHEGVEEIEELRLDFDIVAQVEDITHKINEIIRHLNTKKHE